MGTRSSVPNGRAPQPTSETLAPVQASPLWGLTCVLGDIAARVERRRAEEHTASSPELKCAAGSDPTASGVA